MKPYRWTYPVVVAVCVVSAATEAHGSTVRPLGVQPSGAAPTSVTPQDSAATRETSAPPPPTAGTAGTTSLAYARRLHKRARTSFDAKDYRAAIAIWREAYAALPAPAHRFRNDVVYNLATAHQRAYQQHHAARDLRQAALLLRTYIDNHRRVYPDTPQAASERSRARARLAQLERTLADLARSGASTATGAQPSRSPSPKQEAAKKKADAMFIAGSVLIAVGVPTALAGAGAGVASALADNKPPLRIASAVLVSTGLAMSAAVAALLAVAAKRHIALRREALEAKRPQLPSLAPWLQERTAGITLSGRFGPR